MDQRHGEAFTWVRSHGVSASLFRGFENGSR
jgi:hypothetical protein